MKVLHLHASDLYGGVETFLLTLEREKHFCPDMQHLYAACFSSRFTEELKAVEANLFLLPGGRYSRPWATFQARKKAAEIIKNHAPDIAVTHMPKLLWLFGPVLKRLKIPIVLYIHAPLTYNWAESLCRKFPPDLIVGVSHHTLGTGHNCLFPNIPGAVINYPMPFSIEKFDSIASDRDAIRQELGVSDKVVIMQATRMAAWKGHKELLDALALLNDRDDWVFVLAGGPQNPNEEVYFQNLKDRAAELGISQKIVFLGQRKDVPRILIASDIYCQANIVSEGFSLSFTEAFSAGLPIVTTDIGSASEVVPPSVGILTPVSDAEALASALRTLIADPEKRNALRAATRQHIFRLSDTRQQIQRIYSEFRSLIPKTSD